MASKASSSKLVDDDLEVILTTSQEEKAPLHSYLPESLKLSDTRLSIDVQTATATVGSFTAGVINLCLATVHY